MIRHLWLPLAALVALLALPRDGAAQQGATCPAGETCPRAHGHAEMQGHHEAMMARHAAAAARIQELQDAMHAATGAAKVDAIAALLDEMLAQHRAMHAMMMESHHPGGMKHEGMKPEGTEPDGDR